MEILAKLIAKLLIALYQSFGSAVIVACLMMFAYLYAKEHGIKKAIHNWCKALKHDSRFRGILFLSLFIAMMLFRTLLSRSMWTNPVQNVLGVWGIRNEKGELTTETIENFILFVPFTFLLYKTFYKKLFKKSKLVFWEIIVKSTLISFLFSLGIELVQLFCKLGTFQLSDLFYNTIGGIVGGIVYYICYRKK